MTFCCNLPPGCGSHERFRVADDFSLKIKTKRDSIVKYITIKCDALEEIIMGTREEDRKCF